MQPKRTKAEIRQGIHDCLEAHRRFDYDYIPVAPGWSMPDGHYRYRQRGLNGFATYFWRTVLKIFAPCALKLLFGAKVDGKENLRALGKSGAICICNHFHYLDTLFVRAAAGQYRSYHTMGPFNNRKGAGGHIIRHGGMLPFSADRAAMKNLNAELERLLRKGKFVNFYPEQAMWWNYQKPRPMKDGAFHYALKFDVPVLPVFCTFSTNKKGRLRRLRIHILPPVYADKSLSKGARTAQMKAEAEKAWKDCYERQYGAPLRYLPEHTK